MAVVSRRLSGRTLFWWLLGAMFSAGITYGSLVAVTGFAAPSPEEAAATVVPTPSPLPPLPAGLDPYLHRANGAVADPINLIFRGADADAVAAAVTRVLGWPAVNGSPMAFIRAGGQRGTGRQLGLDLGGGSRLHVRVEAVSAEEAQVYVLAAVHRDDPAACGHVGRAFDEIRDMVGRGFAAAGYRVVLVHLDNGSSGTHCDSTRLTGDGYAVIIDLTEPRTP